MWNGGCPCCNSCYFYHLKIKSFGISCIFVICELGLMAGLCCSRYFSQISSNDRQKYLSKLILPASSLFCALVINLCFEGYFWIIWCCFNWNKKMQHPLFSSFDWVLQQKLIWNSNIAKKYSKLQDEINSKNERTELI